MEYQGLILDEFQQQAIQLLQQKQSIIVSAPTGSGKTIIAEYAIEKALQEKLEMIYTAPIKALSNQKFRDFTQRYGKENVGIMTGDVTFNPGAPVLIMTTEIFRNALFEDYTRFDQVQYLILDEVHYLDDVDRGSVWEESIIFAPTHINVLCLSATVPNVYELARWVEKVRGSKVHVILEEKRPVPLDEFCYLDKKGVLPLKQAQRQLPRKRSKMLQQWTPSVDTAALEDIVEYLKAQQQLPALYFVFSRKECEQLARRCMGYSLLASEEELKAQARLTHLASLYNLRCSPDDHGLGCLLSRGVAYHHAGMLPALKEVVEQMFTEGLIKLLFATETFALGINMPARSVVFNSLKKFDGIAVRYLKSLEYQQMSGRAGRRGIDQQGYVYADVSGEAITSQGLTRVVHGSLEPIKSQFNLSYNTLLNLYSRLGEDVIKACDKSFGVFQRLQATQKSGGKKQRQKIYAEQRRLIKKKLTLLKSLGYIDNGSLTSKGRFAASINGYEMQFTELFFEGMFENRDPVSLFVIFAGIIYEGRKGDRAPRLSKDLRKLTRQVQERLQVTVMMEQMLDLKSEIRLPDFSMAAIAQAWAAGKPFDSLIRHRGFSAGDVIRVFRQAIQICRQLRKSCHGYEAFTALLDDCLIAINRDEVNALKQLEAFTSI